MKLILKTLSREGCVSYDRLVEVGVPRDVVHIYAIRLERYEIAKRLLGPDGRKMLCFNYMLQAQST